MGFKMTYSILLGWLTTLLVHYSNGQTLECDDPIAGPAALQQYNDCINTAFLGLTCLTIGTYSNALKDCRWCYDIYKCFQIGGPFISTYRPISLPPQPPQVIGVQMELYTRNNPQIPFVFQPNDISQIYNSTFNFSSDTKFIIGGFLNGDSSGYADLVTSALLAYDNYNVIIVNWINGSKTLYTQATANTRLVGRELAYFIESIKNETGYPYSKCHLIGHSLGSQISGYAGEKLPGLGRISGQDPAGPYFYQTDPVVRLDPTDAVFVDVTHTDAGAFGINQSIGHIDFFPNGGSAIQPGCLPTDLTDILNDPLSVISCSHSKVKLYYLASILQDTPNCTFTAYACDSYSDFEAGLCNNCTLNTSPNCAKMGFHSDQYQAAGYPLPAPNNFYLDTTGNSPYCLN